MQQTTIYACRHHSLSLANVTFCENIYTMAAKASNDISVPQTDSLNYTKKVQSHPNSSLVTFYKQYLNTVTKKVTSPNSTLNTQNKQQNMQN